MKLNIGCGKKILDGYINLDLFPINSEVKKFDMYKIPYEWDDNSIDEILMEEVFEHICPMHAISIFREFYRILKKDGKIKILTPRTANIIQHTMKEVNPWSIDPFCSGNYSDKKSANLDFAFKKEFCNVKMSKTAYRIIDRFFPFLLKEFIIWELKKE